MIYRGRQGDIIFEFSTSAESQATIILCDGLPSVPKQREVMATLQSRGYDVFFPRYRGTWESDGEFLAQPPTEDIAEIITLIKAGSVTELYGSQQFKINPKVYLVGSSWGGSVVLGLADHPGVDKIVALSPIVNFLTHGINGQGQDLHWLKGFVRQAFNQAYRFRDENWEQMLAGKLFNPLSSIRAGLVTVVYDEGDLGVGSKEIETYCSKSGARTIKVVNLGHLSFSKIPDGLWDDILSS